jgi:hypothetical protein
MRKTRVQFRTRSVHVQTHILSGWCAANLLPLTARQRLLCMIAAAAADVDGFSLLFGQSAYWKYHHVIGHNLPFGLALCTALALISGARAWIFLLYLALFHLHLIMDFFGSGPGWPIRYLWPFAAWSPDNRRWSWEFYSWQNITTAAVLVVWTIVIAVRAGRTPLEVLMPRLDRQLVDWLRKRLSRSSAGAPADQPLSAQRSD